VLNLPHGSAGVNFINVLHMHFLYKFFGAKILNPKQRFVIFGGKILYEKSMRKTFLKLTPEGLPAHMVGQGKAK